mgnify:CR=1 FL=1
MKPAAVVPPAATSSDSWFASCSQTAPRVIAVTSGRRGVGQSVVVVLLGLALRRLGKKVLLWDAALGKAAIHTLLGLQPRFGINDVLAGRCTLAESMVSGPAGLAILPAGPGQTAVAEFGQGEKILLLQELEGCADTFDFLLVDTGAGISEHVMYFNMGAQERIVVTDEEPASIIDAYTLIKVLATKYAEKRFSILFTKISQEAAAKRSFTHLVNVAHRFLHGSVSLDYLGAIPFDAAIVEAVLRQQPVVELAALSPAGCASNLIAQALMVQETTPAMDGNIKFFWQSLHKRAASAFCQGGSREGQLR